MILHKAIPNDVMLLAYCCYDKEQRGEHDRVVEGRTYKVERFIFEPDFYPAGVKISDGSGRILERLYYMQRFHYNYIYLN